MKHPWTLLIRAADGQPIAVVDHPITAARLRTYLCEGSGSSRGAIRCEPATLKTMPRQERNGNLSVEVDWWKIVREDNPESLLAAFLYEPHARGWHELETAGQAFLFRGPRPDHLDRPDTVTSSAHTPNTSEEEAMTTKQINKAISKLEAKQADQIQKLNDTTRELADLRAQRDGTAQAANGAAPESVGASN